MRLFNHLIPWRTDMPDQPDDITRLRKSHYALEDLPEHFLIHTTLLQHSSLPVVVLA